MESLQGTRMRRRAVQNVGQITKAMEVVAATKMRKAQEVALGSRPYALRSLSLLERLLVNTPVSLPLLEVRPVKTTALLVVTSDKGLIGSFNAQVSRALNQLLVSDSFTGSPDHAFAAIAVGKKAVGYAAKARIPVAEQFLGFGDYATPEEIEPLARLVVNGFLEGRWDRVLTVSMHFRTTLTQEALVRQLLPSDLDKIRETVREILPERGKFAGDETNVRHSTKKTIDYIFEPSAGEIIQELIPHLIRTQVYHLILEANASEHSARRVAMKTASDNADELVQNLTILYNKARQAAITKEMIEITSTQSALT